MKKIDHLSEIYNSYETFVIDLWGVMHNGIKLNDRAVEVIENLQKNKKKIVFLSNAPRPSSEVKTFLKSLKLEDKYLENVITSGEAAMLALKEKRFGNFFFHIGPDRDAKIYFDIKKNKTSLEKSDFILCTGLYDTHDNDLNYYKNLLKEDISKILICTNPDLIVHRGKKEELCAGSVAKLYEEIGGKVIYFGKPYKEVYKMCFKDNEKVIAIGDNLRTDIKGANNMKIDNVFILNGVHRSEFENEEKLISLLKKKYNVRVNYFQKELNW